MVDKNLVEHSGILHFLMHHPATILQAIAMAQLRANTLQRPSLLRLHLPSVQLFPWQLMDWSTGADSSYTFYMDRRRCWMLAARGEVASWRASQAVQGSSTSSRMQSLQMWHGEMLQSLVDVACGRQVDGEAPFLLGGMAFDGGKGLMSQQAEDLSPWQAFEKGYFFCSEVLFYENKTSACSKQALKDLEEHSAYLLLYSTAIVPSDSRDENDLWPIYQRIVAALQELLFSQIKPNRTGLCEGISIAKQSLQSPLLWQQTTSQQLWLQDAKKIVKQLNSDAEDTPLKKVVLAYQQEHILEHQQQVDRAQTLWQLAKQQPHCLVYAFGLPQKESHFLGATPECLLQTTGCFLKTHALAGTAFAQSEEDHEAMLSAAFKADTKEQSEHSWVVKMLQQRLAPFAKELTIAQEADVFFTGSLYHLETPINATLYRAGQILALLEIFHPTPAVAGYPVAEAMVSLRRYERFDRGLYAGPLGYCTAAGDGFFAVALRCALFYKNHLFLYAGVGLVAASDALQELLEIQKKLQVMQQALVLHQQPAAKLSQPLHEGVVG